jgi:hypothetical protein
VPDLHGDVYRRGAGGSGAATAARSAASTKTSKRCRAAASDDRFDRRRDDDDRDEPRLSRRAGVRGPGFRADALPHRGGLILTLGILSIALCIHCCWLAPLWGLGFGVPAWIMGQSDLNKIRAGIIDPEGEGNTRAGWICGIVGTCLGVLSLVGGVFFVLLMIATNH